MNTPLSSIRNIPTGSQVINVNTTDNQDKIGNDSNITSTHYFSKDNIKITCCAVSMLAGVITVPSALIWLGFAGPCILACTSVFGGVMEALENPSKPLTSFLWGAGKQVAAYGAGALIFFVSLGCAYMAANGGVACVSNLPGGGNNSGACSENRPTISSPEVPKRYGVSQP